MSKHDIKQMHRFEGSIVEVYLTREITHFGSHYFASDMSCLRNRPNRHNNW